MRITPTYVCIVVLAIAAVCVPPIVSFQIARRESVSHQGAQLSSIAADLARRSDETGTQFGKARSDLNSGKFGSPGSPTDLQHMRALTLTSTYLQAVGRMRGTQILCTSMGTLNPPVDLGPPDLITVNGVRMWLNTQPVFAGGASFHALESQGCVIFIAPKLVLDVYYEEPGLIVAIVTGTSKQIISHRGTIQPTWLKRIGTANSDSFAYDKYVVATKHCKTVDIVAFAAEPITHTYAHLVRLSLIMVPIGIATGLVTAVVLLRFANKHQSFPHILKTAVRKRDFVMHYQPIVNLATGRIVGAEALLRWRLGTGEIVLPDVFLPIASSTGLMGKITEIVIECTMKDARHIKDIYPGLYLNVNIGPTDILSGGLANYLVNIARKNRVDLNHFGIEITEVGLLEGEHAIAAVNSIRTTGVKIAMDDFGTGYSSIAYLMTLNIDCIKIDRLFVESIGKASATSRVIDHMIYMGKELGKYIVAEGIETHEQLQYLVQRGVQFGQGFLFAKPMPLDALLAILNSDALCNPE